MDYEEKNKQLDKIEKEIKKIFEIENNLSNELNTLEDSILKLSLNMKKDNLKSWLLMSFDYFDNTKEEKEKKIENEIIEIKKIIKEIMFKNNFKINDFENYEYKNKLEISTCIVIYESLKNVKEKLIKYGLVINQFDQNIYTVSCIIEY